ncbi:hypothetical protein OK016_16485 [Vibrio chagasii]|nr:hypothetical protein [Vibrio chagasii]
MIEALLDSLLDLSDPIVNIEVYLLVLATYNRVETSGTLFWFVPRLMMTSPAVRLLTRRQTSD